MTNKCHKIASSYYIINTKNSKKAGHLILVGGCKDDSPKDNGQIKGFHWIFSF